MFSQDTAAFLRDLKQNNTKDWFNANKTLYVAHIKDAAADFCDDLAPRLAAQYDTKVTSKVFRIHRDLRFSKDKTPYNPHVHISFADEATGAAWMFGLQPDQLVIGFGLFAFDKARLVQWRDTVAGPDGDQLSSILGHARSNGLRMDKPALKRVPSPYASDHQNADLLRRKGLALWQDGLSLNQAYGPNAPATLVNAMSVFDPVRQWLIDCLPRH